MCTYTVRTTYCVVTAGHRRGNEAVAEAGLQDLIGANVPSPSRVRRRDSIQQTWKISGDVDGEIWVVCEAGGMLSLRLAGQSPQQYARGSESADGWPTDSTDSTRQHTPVKDEQSSNSGRRRGRVGSHVGRGSSWLAGPVCSPARSSMSTAGCIHPYRDDGSLWLDGFIRRPMLGDSVMYVQRVYCPVYVEQWRRGPGGHACVPSRRRR